MMTKGSGKSIQVFTHQSDAVLNQAAPVQNTWYTVLDTTSNVRLYGLAVFVADTGETIEVKITIDGVSLTGSQAQNANTYYYYFKDPSQTNICLASTTLYLIMYYTFLEGKSVKVEVRKTTATGAGQLFAKVTYARNQ